MGDGSEPAPMRRQRAAAVGSVAALVLQLGQCTWSADAPTSLDRALEAIPTQCVPEQSYTVPFTVSVDFLDRARAATWWPDEDYVAEWLVEAEVGLHLSASDASFGGGTKTYRFVDEFGYDEATPVL